MTRIVFWLRNSSKYDSLHLQSRIVEQVLNRKGVQIDWVFCDTTNLLNLASVYRIVMRSSRVYLIYGSFDPLFILFMFLKPITLVFHNITPAKYFIKSNPLVSIRSILGVLQIKYISKKASQIIAVSQFNYDVLYNYRYKLIDICPCVVNEFRNPTNYKKSCLNSVVYIGRIVENKNTIELLSQMIKVANKLEDGLDLYFVGNGNPGRKYYEKFKSTVSKMSNKKLRFHWITEGINDQEIERILAEAWLYVSMSLHEGFGLPVCESISAGTPALYLECGATEDVLNRYGSVPVQDADIFYMKVLEVLSIKEKRETLLNNQRRYVKKYYLLKLKDTIEHIYMKNLNECLLKRSNIT